jgi:hypothetical protein
MPTPLSRGQIAQQLEQGLRREIGHPIAIERLLGEPRYARDVLLVCDALPSAELRALAALFRAQEQAPTNPEAPGAPSASTLVGSAPMAPGSAGFGQPLPAMPSPIADPPPGVPGVAPVATPARKSWLSRLARW